jgi:hypothetical protein
MSTKAERKRIAAKTGDKSKIKNPDQAMKDAPYLKGGQRFACVHVQPARADDKDHYDFWYARVDLLFRKRMEPVVYLLCTSCLEKMESGPAPVIWVIEYAILTEATMRKEMLASVASEVTTECISDRAKKLEQEVFTEAAEAASDGVAN